MSGSNVWLKSGKVYNLTPAAGVTTTGAQQAIYKDSPYSAIQATVIGTGAVTATIKIEVSLDGVYWCVTPAGTITLSGTDSTSDGFATQSSWKYIRANITAITGTSATIYVNMGV
jgi:hypothetical protein